MSEDLYFSFLNVYKVYDANIQNMNYTLLLMIGFIFNNIDKTTFGNKLCIKYFEPRIRDYHTLSKKLDIIICKKKYNEAYNVQISKKPLDFLDTLIKTNNINAMYYLLINNKYNNKTYYILFAKRYLIAKYKQNNPIMYRINKRTNNMLNKIKFSIFFCTYPCTKRYIIPK